MKDIQSFLFDVKNNSSIARYLDIFEFTEDEKMLASALLDEIDHYRRLSKKYRRRYLRQMRLNGKMLKEFDEGAINHAISQNKMPMRTADAAGALV